MTISLTLRSMLSVLPQARWLGQDAALTEQIRGVSTDTRTLVPGQVFFALRGDVFDGNEKASQALKIGAGAVVMDSAMLAEALLATSPNASVLLVADTRYAMAELAGYWRKQFVIPVIAVTGSNGKTTVKEMIASILRARYKDGAFATQGNLNNDVGVPQTLFRLNSSVQAAVIELGMNHPGEIAHLAKITQATVALVNNAQREHQEFMKSVVAVARENGSALQALPQDGVAVFPADDVYTSLWQEMAGARRSITFGFSDEAQVRGDVNEADGTMVIHHDGHSYPVSLSIAGVHNRRNALAAAASSIAAGCNWSDVVTGLESFRPVKGRLVAHRFSSINRPDVLLDLIDDSYNANPDSALAAIQVLSAMRSPRCFVLGDMGEVGDQGPQFHAEIGAAARAAGIEFVILLGDLTQYIFLAQTAIDSDQATKNHRVSHHSDIDHLLARVRSLLLTETFAQGGSFLIKGSRFMKMERVVDYLLSLHQHVPVAQGAH